MQHSHALHLQSATIEMWLGTHENFKYIFITHFLKKERKKYNSVPKKSLFKHTYKSWPIISVMVKKKKYLFNIKDTKSIKKLLK